MRKVQEIAWLLLLYIVIGMLVLMVRVASTPWGFLLLTPETAMKHIFFYPLIIIRDLLGL